MKLYCVACNQLHHMTAGEVERALYVLGALHADALVDVQPSQEQDSHSLIECLLQVESYAHDTEMYYEHVQAATACRRALVKDLSGPR
jgi:hypothetical protein